MKVWRYMSKNEFEKYNNGEVIVGKKEYAARTNSTGVCFLQDVTTFVDNDDEEHSFNARDCYDFMSGIVSDELLVCFETDETPRYSYGVYADPYCGGWYDRITITELNFDSYDKNSFKLVSCEPAEKPYDFYSSEEEVAVTEA